MSRLREKAELIMKYGDSVIAEKQRKTVIIKRTACSVSGICAAVAIGFGIWNNDAIKNSADFDKYNSSTIVENSTEPTGTTALTISSEIIVEATTSTVSDITVNSAETSKITTAEPTNTQGGTVSDKTTKKTSTAVTAATATSTQTQLAGNVTVPNTQPTIEDEPTTMTTAELTNTQGGTVSDKTTKKTSTAVTAATATSTQTQLVENVTAPNTQTTIKDEPTTMTTAELTNTQVVTVSDTTTKKTSTAATAATATSTQTQLAGNVTVPNTQPTIKDEPTTMTTAEPTNTQVVTVSDTTTKKTSTAATGTTTTTGGNTTTSSAPVIITLNSGILTEILYDGVTYYKSEQEVDTAYVHRDKRKYLGHVYHNGQDYGLLYYVYDYREQGKPALVLRLYNSNKYRLFLTR